MSSLVRAGKLDREVTILRRGAGTDDGMTIIPGAWAVLDTRWASVKPRMGREAGQADGVQAVTPMSFWMRWDEVTSTITAHDALELDGVPYAIIATPIEIGRREGVEVIAVAGSLPQ